jgi:hypothetical protein
MNEQTPVARKGGMPASIKLENVNCVANGTQATLSADIKIIRTSNEEVCEGPEMFVNGSSSFQTPTAVSSGPSGGIIIDAYSWSEDVACDATYQLEARAQVCLKIDLTTGIVTKTCPPCGE